MKFETHHTQSATEYESQRSQNALINHRKELIEQQFEKFEPKRILDLGCGTGGIVADMAGKFPNREFVGFDPENKFITFAQSKFILPNLKFTNALNTNIGFDLIYSIDVLHHVDNWQDFVPWVQSLLSPQGKWLLIEPNSYNLYIYILQRRPGERPFATKQFSQQATRVGMKLERSFYYHLWPSGIKSVSAFGKYIENIIEKVPVLAGSVVQIWKKV